MEILAPGLAIRATLPVIIPKVLVVMTGFNNIMSECHASLGLKDNP